MLNGAFICLILYRLSLLYSGIVFSFSSAWDSKILGFLFISIFFFFFCLFSPGSTATYLQASVPSLHFLPYPVCMQYVQYLADGFIPSPRVTSMSSLGIRKFRWMVIRQASSTMGEKLWKSASPNRGSQSGFPFRSVATSLVV